VPSEDPLADALAHRLERVERYVARETLAWIEEVDLPLPELRLVVAMGDWSSTDPAGLAKDAGLSVDAAHEGINELRTRGLVKEGEHRQQHLTESGQAVVDAFKAIRRSGIARFVADLPQDDRDRLATALGEPA
jgi:hypothetical protein